MEALLNTREEVVENLCSAERPLSLQRELLATVHDIDKELGHRALFTLDESYYQIPPVRTKEEVQTVATQTEALF